MKTANVPQGTVHLYYLPGGRQGWVYSAPSITIDSRYDLPGRLGGYPVLVALEGRLYKEMLRAPAMLDYLVATGAIPPVIALFVDNPQSQELLCAPGFADYMAHQVLPWLRANFPVTIDPALTVIAGARYGGLAAVYLALRHPALFGQVLSQTGWFRWRTDDDPDFHWLARQVAQLPKLPLRFYLDVGNLAVAPMCDGGPPQLAANRHLRNTLLAKGYPVHYAEYSGDHDYSTPASPLLSALTHVLSAAASEVKSV